MRYNLQIDFDGLTPRSDAVRTRPKLSGELLSEYLHFLRGKGPFHASRQTRTVLLLCAIL